MNIVYGGTDAFDALLYPQQNQANITYFANQWQTQYQPLSDIAAQFQMNARTYFEEANSAEALRLARNAVMMTNTNHDGYVFAYQQLPEIQTATPFMQRWLMAEPTIKQAYVKQTVHGYGDSYHPNNKYHGEHDYDYRLVTNGLVMPTEDGYQLNHYMDYMVGNERELDVDEQFAITDTWRIMSAFMAAGIDPTDPFSEV